jgi:hypothetical protein
LSAHFIRADKKNDYAKSLLPPSKHQALVSFAAFSNDEDEQNLLAALHAVRNQHGVYQPMSCFHILYIYIRLW